MILFASVWGFVITRSKAIGWCMHQTSSFESNVA
jgi:hypothetical protein